MIKYRVKKLSPTLHGIYTHCVEKWEGPDSRSLMLCGNVKFCTSLEEAEAYRDAATPADMENAVGFQKP